MKPNFFFFYKKSIFKTNSIYNNIFLNVAISYFILFIINLLDPKITILKDTCGFY